MKTIAEIRADFPILEREIYGKPLIYLDNGATTQKPRCVIDTINDIHFLHNSNIHRGVHFLSDTMSEMYEASRQKVATFINAEKKEEVIFTSGATGSINMLAFSFGERFVSQGDEIIISCLEHHANIVPWQMLCERKGAKLKIIPITENGEIILEEYYRLLSKKTKLVAVAHVSNALGVILPIDKIISAAHSMDIPVMIDGSQGIQHGAVDVQKLDCDFYLFSGHKIYAPTGTGILYGKEEWLNNLPPYQGGGDMVECVRFEKTTYNELPFKFEAGTANYIDAVGLESAIRYIETIGVDTIAAHEYDLMLYAREQLSKIDGIRFFGTAENKIATFSFLLGKIHPYDTGMVLDKLGIAVRTGAHCTQPLMQRFGIEGTVRASMVFYNTRDEIDLLCKGLERAKAMFNNAL